MKNNNKRKQNKPKNIRLYLFFSFPPRFFVFFFYFSLLLISATRLFKMSLSGSTQSRSIFFFF